jgi:hypothetical protein
MLHVINACSKNEIQTFPHICYILHFYAFKGEYNNTHPLLSSTSYP